MDNQIFIERMKIFFLKEQNYLWKIIKIRY